MVGILPACSEVHSFILIATITLQITKSSTSFISHFLPKSSQFVIGRFFKIIPPFLSRWLRIQAGALQRIPWPAYSYPIGLEDSVDKYRIQLTYNYKGAAPSILVADVTSLDELGDSTRRGSGCNRDQRQVFDSKSK